MDNKYEFIVNLSRDFITLINRTYRYEVVNDAYCKNISLERDQIIGRTVSEVWGEDRFNETIKSHLDRCFEGHEVHYIDRFKFGLNVKYMHISFYPYILEDTVTHALVFSHDITRLGDIESKLINYEYRDPVTGLFNRRSLDIILDMEIEKAKRATDHTQALLFISLNNISEINETYGPAVGDVLLENTGLRIRELLRDSDYTFRFEGRELAIILTHVTADMDVAKVSQKISDEISIPYSHTEGDIILRSSIGAAIFPEDGNSREKLIRNAAATMNEARRVEAPFLLFDSRVHSQALKRLKLEGDMLKAFERREFALVYQPIVEADGTVRGAEGLIRWHHPERGLVSPDDFIPVAEKSGIIQTISKWVLFSAARTIGESLGKKGVYLSVNLSTKDFMSDDLEEIIAAALDHGNVTDPSCLKVEMTETGYMSDPDRARDRITSIQDMGVEVLIDDFGTGHSSLLYLKHLPAKILKLDRMFIEGISNSSSDRIFLEKVVGLVHARGKSIVAEGVETEMQAQFLRDLGCQRLQGFFFSKPLTLDEFLPFLDK